MVSYGYSQTLAELVVSCLEMDKDCRPTFEQFLSTLKTGRHPMSMAV